ncbi:MAG: hypothetical protein CL663_06210 [Bacteroidetes bacterium]|nr:hypothetical protein [Bacteroidota bacterium]|tara:strand:- start:199 stop:894 length:696 start_codon:yes stop_codon:yes gene_type:complete
MRELENLNSCKSCVYNKLLFGGLTDEELDFFTEHKQELEFKKGEIISKEGAPITSFLYLKEGLVKLYKESPGSKSQIISIAKPLDFISLLSIFSNSTYKYNVAALEDTVVCSIHLDAFKKVIGQNGPFALEIMSKMSKMYDDIIESRFEINRKHLRGRIAFILLYFSNHIYHSDEFELPISRREIAELIEMTTENVIRILSEFRKDNIVQIDGKNIKLIEPERIESICKLG